MIFVFSVLYICIDNYSISLSTVDILILFFSLNASKKVFKMFSSLKYPVKGFSMFSSRILFFWNQYFWNIFDCIIFFSVSKPVSFIFGCCLNYVFIFHCPKWLRAVLKKVFKHNGSLMIPILFCVICTKIM